MKKGSVVVETVAVKDSLLSGVLQVEQPGSTLRRPGKKRSRRLKEQLVVLVRKVNTSWVTETETETTTYAHPEDSASCSLLRRNGCGFDASTKFPTPTPHRPKDATLTQNYWTLGKVVELEQGCEARADSDAEDAFSLLTAKRTYRFRAAGRGDRDAWVGTLEKEFHAELELLSRAQKVDMLVRGVNLRWYRAADLPPLEVRCYLDKTNNTLVLAPTSTSVEQHPEESWERVVPLAMVGEITPGNLDSSLLGGAFHFNCFSIRLKIPTPELLSKDEEFRAVEVLEFEAESTAQRDEIVTATQTQLVVPAPQKQHRPSSVGFEALSSSPGRPNTNSKRRTSFLPPLLQKSSRGDDDLGNLDVSSNSLLSGASNVSDKPAGGVGELFKTKVKLKEGFPYAAAISEALSSEPMEPTDTTTKTLTKADYKFSRVEKFTISPDAVAKPSKKKTLKKPVVYELVEHAPVVFRRLRVAVDIADDEFRTSFKSLSGDGLVGDGKSGMLFFFTEDRRYVLKTLKPNELDLFLNRGLIQSYVEHLLKHRDSLICRFLGLYTFRKLGPGKSPKDIVMVAMSNSFDTRLVLHEKYDLKGSTRSRWVKPKFGAVLKDLNMTSKIRLDESDREELVKQLEADARMLESHNVMDYSLLLGVHRPPQTPNLVRRLCLLKEATGEAQVVPRPTRWQRDFGGVEGRSENGDVPEVYILTLIDILQAYDTGKKMEHTIKATMTGKENQTEISAVNPKLYRKRFVAYMNKITEGRAGQNEAIERARLKVSQGGHSAEETQRIVGETEADLQKFEEAGGGAAFVETLEDGTEVTILKGGGFIQRAIDRTIVRQYSDGTMLQSNPDGSTVRRDADGAVTSATPDGEVVTAKAERRRTQLADGTVIEETGSKFVQTNPDGSVLTKNTDTGVSEQLFADGTHIRHDAETGVKTQVNPDGIQVVTNPDGSRVQTDPSRPSVTVTTFPNGNVLQVDSETGIEILTSKDPAIEEHRFPDGVKIVKSGGVTTQYNVDGSRVVQGSDGKREEYDRNGKAVMAVPPLLREASFEGDE